MFEMSRRVFLAGAAASLALSKLSRAQPKLAVQHPYPGIWKSDPPDNCPLTPSTSLREIYFTGRHQQYTHADTWYPSWAGDGVQYSSFTDGHVINRDGKTIHANSGVGFKSTTGYAKITGDDPMHLSVEALGTWPASGMPYGGRYPCANLVHNGIWYYGTYVVDIQNRTVDGRRYNWAWLGPFLGCRYSKDFGKTWKESPCKPWAPLFREDIDDKGSQIRALESRKTETQGNTPGDDMAALIPGLPLPRFSVLHFVDFGKNMEHSPDGKAYLVGHGNAPDTPHPRFGAVNWLSGNAIYLTRLNLSVETVNDVSKYEFFAGYDAAGAPVWTRRFSEMKPMLEWKNHLGSVTVTYNRGLKKYLMCIADGWPSTESFNTILMEANNIAGPWKMISYLKAFGPQGYFVNIPSKFISEDGKQLWLCYSANFKKSWVSQHYPTIEPPGSEYGLCLQEIKLA